jgi:hypothetical protein
MSAALSITDWKILFITIIIMLVPYAILVSVINPPPTMLNSGVADLEKTLIGVNGILLGFAGIMFAQLLAGGQTQRRTGDQSQRNLSNLLLRLPVRGAVIVVAYFTVSIVISIWILTVADANPDSTTKIGDAVVLPLLSMIFALILLLSYMVRYGTAQRSLNETSP